MTRLTKYWVFNVPGADFLPAPDCKILESIEFLRKGDDGKYLCAFQTKVRCSFRELMAGIGLSADYFDGDKECEVFPDFNAWVMITHLGSLYSHRDEVQRQRIEEVRRLPPMNVQESLAYKNK